MEKKINVELLRIISMFMILALHYLNQGKVLSMTKPSDGAVYYIVWIIEGICYISVNLYMFISGYFLSTKNFSWRRVISLYVTIVFYVIVISSIVFITGFVELDMKTILSIIPIVSRNNWFVTVYFAILFIMPLLNLVVNKIEKNLYKKMLIVLFVMFSVLPSVFYWTDQFNLSDGYSILWYSYIYLVAAYIRRYGLVLKPSLRKCMIMSILLLPLSKFVIHSFFSTTMLKGAEDCLFSYNSYAVFLASLAVFVRFIDKDKLQKKWGGL